MKKLFFFFFFSLFSTNIFPQAYTLPLLNLSQSSELLASGGIGAAIISDASSAFFQNPAMLAQNRKGNHLTFSFMPEKASHKYWSEYKLKNYSIRGGYEFKSFNIPISIGVGYIHSKWDMGHIDNLVYNKEAYELFDCFSAAIGFKLKLVKISVGASYKKALEHSSLRPTEELDVNALKRSSSSFDFGTMAFFPLSDVFLSGCGINLEDKMTIKPVINATLGYSALNIGDGAEANIYEAKDPIGRMQKLGYSFDFGLDLDYKKGKINFFTYTFSAETENYLISSYVDPITGKSIKSTNKNLFSGIKLWDNFICLNPSKDVMLRKAHRIKLFDTFILSTGRYIRTSEYVYKGETKGFGVTSEGLLGLLSNLAGDSIIKKITDHLEIKYFQAEYDFGIYDSFEPNELTITLKNLYF